MDIVALIDKFGVQVGLLVFFVWQNWKVQKEHKDDMKGIAIQAVQALDKTTDALMEITPLLAELRVQRGRDKQDR